MKKKEIVLDGDLIGVRASQDSLNIVSCRCTIQGGFQASISTRTAVILYNGLKLLDHVGGVLDAISMRLNSFS